MKTVTQPKQHQQSGRRLICAACHNTAAGEIDRYAVGTPLKGYREAACQARQEADR